MQPRHARARIFLLRALAFVPKPAVRGSHSAHDSVPHSQPSLAPPAGVAMLKPSDWPRRSAAAPRSRPEKMASLTLLLVTLLSIDQWGRRPLGPAQGRLGWRCEPVLAEAVAVAPW